MTLALVQENGLLEQLLQLLHRTLLAAVSPASAVKSVDIERLGMQRAPLSPDTLQLLDFWYFSFHHVSSPILPNKSPLVTKREAIRGLPPLSGHSCVVLPSLYHLSLLCFPAHVTHPWNPSSQKASSHGAGHVSTVHCEAGPAAQSDPRP